MKAFVLFLAVVVFSINRIYAQALSNDPAFGQTVAKLIRYPALAHQQQKVSEAYVNFKIDSQGKITDVSVLDATHVDPSFKKEISRVWKQLPIQDRKYKGDYVLPVSFMLDTKSQLKRAKPESSILIQKSGQYTLLKGVVVTAYI